MNCPNCGVEVLVKGFCDKCEAEYSRRKKPIDEDRLDTEFRRGYYMAVANLMRLHDCDVLARDTLAAYGKFDARGIAHCDLKVLRRLARETKRLEQKGTKP